MYKKLIGILLLLTLCFPVAMAIDFSGTITASSPISYFESSGGGINGGVGGTNISVPWWVNFDTTGTPDYYLMYDITNNYLSGSTTFQINDTTGVFATGTFSALNGTFSPSTRKQYYLMEFDTWNPGTRSGTSNALLTVPAAGVIAMGTGLSLDYGVFGGSTQWSPSPGNLTMGGGTTVNQRVMMGGAIEYGLAQSSVTTYTVTRTSGLGDGTLARIVATKDPANNIASRLYVIGSVGESPVYYTSPWTDKTGTTTIDVVGNNYYLQSYVSALTPKYYNSSVITFVGAPTPTPTPTGTPVPSVPAGAVRTTIFVTDGSTGSKIVGASLGVLDVTNGTWTNSTSSIAGSVVDVLAGHTLDIYGNYPGVYTASQELGATAGGNYYLPLMPPIPTQPVGYVNVIINVQDSTTHEIVPSASVSFRLPTGATTVESTGTWGTAQTVQPNNTVIIVGVSKSGYQSISISLNSGTGADIVRTLQLTKNTVATPTPTVTDPGTGLVITPVPTVLPGCEDPTSPTCIQSQDSSLMARLRTAAPGIVDLSIAAVYFGLIGMIFYGLMRWGK